MNMAQFVELELAGETEVLRDNPSQCYFAHHKSNNLTWDQTRPTVLGSQKLIQDSAQNFFNISHTQVTLQSDLSIKLT
jgi:hypothetical protein